MTALFFLRNKLKTKQMQMNQKQENATRFNNRDDLLQLRFILKILIFSEAYI